MALTGLDDPGLTVFPTHRLLSGFAEDPERQRRLGEGLRELFDVERGRRPTELDPLGEEGVGVFGLYDSHHKRGLPPAAQGQAIAALDRAARGQARGLPPPRRGDPRDPGAEGDRRAERRRHPRQARASATRRASRTRCALLEDGTYDVAFILRPIPVDQVKAICESDENMPPKSTYFYPKVLTGLVFNPVG